MGEGLTGEAFLEAVRRAFEVAGLSLPEMTLRQRLDLTDALHREADPYRSGFYCSECGEEVGYGEEE
ncbi:hypothetical protein [Caulobacter sp. BK020]|uniref:hypothetical protein n=1 Tax=Caulobacter sp. BK020 TaxID=2512117 RepID=UPI00104565D0|nr:hypothetical protein [Caulobacter sp. BK020]